MSVLLISPAGTGGWRENERALAAAIERLGFEIEVRRVELGRAERLRHPWATGAPLVAAAARRELRRALRDGSPEAVVAVNSTAAALLPSRRLRGRGIPLAVRIDSPAGEQFPGAVHAPMRALERRALASADLVLSMGPRSSAAVRSLTDRVAEVPLGIDVPAPRGPASPPLVLAYASQPAFKGLDLICRAWTELGAGRRDATLAVTGLAEGDGRAFLARRGVPVPDAVRWEGALRRDRYLELLAGATAYVSASRLEGHGIAQLEALAAGVPLVTTPSRGAYEAEPIARELAPELVAEPEPAAIAAAIGAALEMSPGRRAEYARGATEAVDRFRAGRVDPALREAFSRLGLSAPAPTGGRSAR